MTAVKARAYWQLMRMDRPLAPYSYFGLLCGRCF